MKKIVNSLLILLLGGCASPNKSREGVAIGKQILRMIRIVEKDQCRTNKIKSLLVSPHFLREDQINVTFAINEECFDTVLAVIERYPSAAVQAMSQHSWKIKDMVEKDLSFKNRFWNQEVYDSHRQFFRFVNNNAKTFCADPPRKLSSYEKSTCEEIGRYSNVLNRYREAFIVKKIEREKDSDMQEQIGNEVAKQKAYNASPLAIRDKACNALANVKFFQQRIDSQREAASHSGYVDKKVMYESGMSIKGSKQLYTEYSVEFKKLTGKNPRCK